MRLEAVALLRGVSSRDSWVVSWGLVLVGLMGGVRVASTFSPRMFGLGRGYWGPPFIAGLAGHVASLPQYSELHLV